MQNFSHLLQGEHFQIEGWMKGGRKNVHFSMENWPCLGNGEDVLPVLMSACVWHVEMMMSHHVHTHTHRTMDRMTNLLISSNVHYVHLGWGKYHFCKWLKQCWLEWSNKYAVCDSCVCLLLMELSCASGDLLLFCFGMQSFRADIERMLKRVKEITYEPPLLSAAAEQKLLSAAAAGKLACIIFPVTAM